MQFNLTPDLVFAVSYFVTTLEQCPHGGLLLIGLVMTFGILRWVPLIAGQRTNGSMLRRRRPRKLQPQSAQKTGGSMRLSGNAPGKKRRTSTDW